jgi:hypothetical protein
MGGRVGCARSSRGAAGRATYPGGGSYPSGRVTPATGVVYLGVPCEEKEKRSGSCVLDRQPARRVDRKIDEFPSDGGPWRKERGRGRGQQTR